MTFPDIGDTVEWVNTYTHKYMSGFVESLIVDHPTEEPLFITEQREWGYVHEIVVINGRPT